MSTFVDPVVCEQRGGHIPHEMQPDVCERCCEDLGLLKQEREKREKVECAVDAAWEGRS